MSVTLTSATSVLCFLCGSISAFPAVSHFCVYAGLSMMFIYAFHMTAFCAMLSVDTRRQQAGRLDVLCCFRARAGDVVGLSDETESFGERVMMKYTRAITSHILVKFVVVCSFLCSAGLFLWQAIEHTDTSFSAASLAPDDSYMRKFLEAENEYWGGDSTSLDLKVGLYFRGIEESDAAMQAQIMMAENALLAVSCISEQKGAVSWHRRFSDWARANKHSPVHGLWTADDFENIDGHEFLSGPRFYALWSTGSQTAPSAAASRTASSSRTEASRILACGWCRRTYLGAMIRSTAWMKWRPLTKQRALFCLARLRPPECTSSTTRTG
jgi:hypothetical protein